MAQLGLGIWNSQGQKGGRNILSWLALDRMYQTIIVVSQSKLSRIIEFIPDRPPIIIIIG